MIKMSDIHDHWIEIFSKFKNWLPGVSTLFLPQNDISHKKMTQLLPKGLKTLTIRTFYDYFIKSIMFYNTRSVLMTFQARRGFFNRRGFKERGVRWECHWTRNRWSAKFNSFTVVSKLFCLKFTPPLFSPDIWQWFVV